ncbi:hypothetical protein ACFVH6_20725 [Spirillospora sp. NPDC127200]
MTALELLETTDAATLEEFVADEISASPLMFPDAFDNRPTWDNWSKR